MNSKRCTFEEFKPQSLEKHEHHTRKKAKVSGLSFVLKRRLRCKVYEVRLSLLHSPGKISFFFLKTGESVKVTRKMRVTINYCFKITSHVIQSKERGLDKKDWHKKKL